MRQTDSAPSEDNPERGRVFRTASGGYAARCQNCGDLNWCDEDTRRDGVAWMRGCGWKTRYGRWFCEACLKMADQPQWRDTGAIFSPCGAYRYQLWREWADGPRVVWVMLNPSTADAEVFDPTVRRCYGFSKRWGYGKMSVVNLYALRSTDPKGLWSVDDPVGPDNNAHIRLELSVADLVIAAWGVNAKADRVQAFCELARPYEVRCMGTTRAGCPRHPLYLRNDQGHGLWTRSPV